MLSEFEDIFIFKRLHQEASVETIKLVYVIFYVILFAGNCSTVFALNYKLAFKYNKRIENKINKIRTKEINKYRYLTKCMNVIKPT